LIDFGDYSIGDSTGSVEKPVEFDSKVYQNRHCGANEDALTFVRPAIPAYQIGSVPV
jgi:hypothetical protein